MSRKSGITINGMMLDEYLRDNESIEEEIKSKEFIRDGLEKRARVKQVRAKYPPLKEKNGKVNILDKLEINMANFEKDLKRELRAKNSVKSIVVVIVAHSEQRLYETNEVAKILIDFGKKHNIPVSPNISWPLRSSLGTLRRSKLGEYLEYNPRSSKRASANFGLKKEYKSAFTTQEALEMVKINVIERSYNRKDKQPSQEKNIPTIKKQEVILKENELKTSVANKIVEELKSFSNKEGPLFTIQGDIHIHVNINNS